MNELKEGMKFKNAREMCDFIGEKYDVDHAPRVYKRLACYCDFHRAEGKTILVDKVFDEPDFSNYEKRNNDYIYNIGDIFETPSGKIEVIEKIRLGDKNRKAYICKCLVCNTKHPRFEYNLKNNIGCPVCSNKKVFVGINDMWTTNPDKAKLLLNPEDGYKYTKSSGVKADWKCPVCGETVRGQSISNVYKRGLRCPSCSKTQSYPNRLMYNLLKYLKIPFENEIIFDWSRIDNTFKRYDFYIPDYGILEMQGRQHTSYCNFHKLSGRTLQDDIDNDKYKKTLALNNNIKNYLQIDCRESSLKFIKKNILESDLAKEYDLSKVDWEYVDQQSQLNCLEVICDLWNSGIHDKKILVELSGLSSGIVTKYLNKGNHFNIIDYDKKKTKAIGNIHAQEKLYQLNAKPMVCNENGLYFGSLQLCKNKMQETTGLKFFHGNITGTMTGRYAHHHNFTFKYITRDEFNIAKKLSPEISFGEFFIATEQPTPQSA